MSTKNLARAVIEGGRYRGNALDRRRWSQVARTAERARLAASWAQPPKEES